MRRLGLGLGFGSRVAGAGGGGGGTAPTISGTPLLTDSEINVTGDLPMTFHYTNTSSATPPSAATIKAAPDSRSLSSGANSITGLTQEVNAGTWYFHYLVGNAAGDSAIQTESYVRTAPTISSTVPADNATGVAATTSPTITFSVPVAFGTGLITLREFNGTWSDLETFDVVTEVGAGNGQVSISGAVLTINPTASLTASREYAIRIAATAIENLDGTPFAGIANDTTISFTVAAIRYVGGKAVAQAGATSDYSAISLADLTGGLGSAPIEGDLVLICYGIGANADLDVAITTSGYTEIVDLYRSGSDQSNLGLFRKFMSASPDTGVIVTASGNNNHAGSISIHVWRGVNQTTPLDVIALSSNAIGTGRPTPPPITPITPGAVIVCAGVGAVTSGADFTTSDLSNFVTEYSPDVYAVTSGLGSFAWSSGTFTPAQWGGNSSVANDTCIGVSIALRPA